jgi:hypothetical protein
MARIVMKFGGTSVADLERIRNVARHVKREVDAGHQVAVVVSAMAGQDERARRLVPRGSPLHDAREYDAVVASGEQVTAGLLAIVLQASARRAPGRAGRSRSDRPAHGAARISTSTARRSSTGSRSAGGRRRRRLPGHRADDNRITTLGRGGSDTSAVALAPPSGRSAATSTPMSTASTPPIRASCPRRAAPASPSRRCWRWPRSARRCCRCARSSWRWSTTCRPSCARASTIRRCPQTRERNPDLRRGRDRGTADRHRHRLFQGRGQDHPAARRRQAGRRGQRSSAAGRRQHQCRHDRPGVSPTATTDITFTVPRSITSGDGVISLASEGSNTRSCGRDRRGQGLGDRGRHAQPCRRRGPDVQGLADKGINIRAITTSEIKFSS